jgi:hypothetical protein
MSTKRKNPVRSFEVRDISIADAADYQRAFNASADHLEKYLEWGASATQFDLKRCQDILMKIAAERYPDKTFAICSWGKLVGEINFGGGSRHDGLQITYWVGKNNAGRGLCTKAVKKLMERLEWEEIYSEDNNATCIQGVGFKLDENSKKIPYTITNGVLKYGVDVTNTKFMNRQINIPVITDMALNYFTLEDTFSSLPQPICASKKYEDEEKEQCTINYNGYNISIINGRINVYAFNDLIPKLNELLICYTDLKEPNKIFPFKVWADIQYQFKNNILYTNDFTAFIIQLFKNNLTDLNNYEDAETLQRTMEKIMKSEKNNYFNSWEDSKTK